MMSRECFPAQVPHHEAITHYPCEEFQSLLSRDRKELKHGLFEGPDEDHDLRRTL